MVPVCQRLTTLIKLSKFIIQEEQYIVLMDQGNFPPPSNEYSEVDDQNASTLMSTKHPNTAENSKSFDPRHSFNFNKLSPEVLKLKLVLCRLP